MARLATVIVRKEAIDPPIQSAALSVDCVSAMAVCGKRRLQAQPVSDAKRLGQGSLRPTHVCQICVREARHIDPPC